MPNTNDDPRQVLALLNSLGFVGITGSQLKAFLKDLKMYRKMKEHKLQEQKENIKDKVLFENQEIIEELLEYKIGGKSSDICNSDLSTSLHHHANSSPVRIKIRYTPKSVDNRHQENVDLFKAESTSRRQTGLLKQDQVNISEVPLLSNSKSAQKRSSCVSETGVSQYTIAAAHLCSDINVSNAVALKPVTSDDTKPLMVLARVQSASAPGLFGQERKLKYKTTIPCETQSARTYSIPRANNLNLCTQKSFIRPWQLQHQGHKFNSVKKSDPVCLYQKYQDEWKKINFPGEATHSNIRWIVRQKMLGANPHPIPLPKKFTTFMLPKTKHLL